MDEFYCCLAWALAKESADRVRAEHLSHLHAEVQKQVGRSGSQTSRGPGFWRRDGRRMNRGGDADDKKPVAADEETYLLKRMRWNVRRKTNRMMGPANLCGLKQLFCQLVARDALCRMLPAPAHLDGCPWQQSHLLPHRTTGERVRDSIAELRIQWDSEEPDTNWWDPTRPTRPPKTLTLKN